MDNNLRKALELVCAAFKFDVTDIRSSVYNVSIPESAFLRQGISIDAGVAALNYALQSSEYAILRVSDIYTASVDNFDDPSLDGDLIVHVTAGSSVCSKLYEPSVEQGIPKPIFKFGNSVLTINGKEIAFGTADAKQKSAYILEHLFSHTHDEPSDYKDIHEEYFFEESLSGKKFYDACKIINKRVLEEAGVKDFLIFNSSNTGSVRVNQIYLP